VFTEEDRLLLFDHYQQGYLDLVTRPYWSRVWILQEYLLSKNIELWCGEGVMKTYRKDSMKASVLEWIFGSLRVQARMELYSSVHLKNTYLAEFQNLKRLTIIDGYTSLDVLITITDQMKCTDVRNRIYAVLSLLNPKEHESWSIRPNYAQPAQGLYENLKDAYLTRTGRPEIAKETTAFEKWDRRVRVLLNVEGCREGTWSSTRAFP
jgi:hypothetical protein